MLTILIFAGIGLLLGVYVIFHEFGRHFIDVGTVILAILTGFIFGAVLAVFGALIALSISCKTEDVVVGRSELMCLTDKSSMQGSFFLGSGTIGETMKYAFYIKNKDQTFRLHVIDAQQAYIKYIKSGNTPYIEQIKVVRSKDDRNVWSCFIEQYKYIFYVPNGSIKQNYTLDAQ